MLNSIHFSPGGSPICFFQPCVRRIKSESSWSCPDYHELLLIRSAHQCLTLPRPRSNLQALLHCPIRRLKALPAQSPRDATRPQPPTSQKNGPARNENRGSILPAIGKNFLDEFLVHSTNLPSVNNSRLQKDHWVWIHPPRACKSLITRLEQ